MNEEEKERVRAWKRGMEEVNRITRDENRRRTPEERLAEPLALMDERGLFGNEERSSNEMTASRKRWRQAVERMHTNGGPGYELGHNYLVNEEEKERVRGWKRGMEEVNRITREENLRRTPEERLKRVMALMASRGMFGRDHQPASHLTGAQARWVAAADGLRARSHP